ncbi:terpene synthase [Selaginella moellendorffii]|uniref:Terpene synthase n=1 Tax=Selaginella moellendorffii TaxID=88036 RepID=D8QQD0_SELML|nr:terpene synthase [Selaginella moellendorffii]
MPGRKHDDHGLLDEWKLVRGCRSRALPSHGSQGGGGLNADDTAYECSHSRLVLTATSKAVVSERQSISSRALQRLTRTSIILLAWRRIKRLGYWQANEHQVFAQWCTKVDSIADIEGRFLVTQMKYARASKSIALDTVEEEKMKVTITRRFQHTGISGIFKSGQLFGSNLKTNAQIRKGSLTPSIRITCCASNPLNFGNTKPAEAPEKRQRKQQPYQGILHVPDDRIEELDYRETSLLVEEVKGWQMKLASGKGEISPSAYDTAWVARIASECDSSLPEFPEALEWIINSQLPDGSWGDDRHLQLYDRVLSTLSCLVTLKTWDIGHNSIAQGTKFLRENMIKLKQDDGDLLSGFEVTFPMMLHEAKKLGLDLPHETDCLGIPLDKLHSAPTTLLYSLEGLQDLEIDWQEILKLQSKDGSFLSSPSSTACVYLKTKDRKSLQYAMQVQNYAVPCHYPIDLFESLWVVDTIERLGIDVFFRDEIKAVLDYVYSFWTNEGIGWGSTCLVNDIDDTAMAFRILRMHGYNVSPDAFDQFWLPRDKFCCFVGELSHGVSEMLNLHRASQVDFPNETILTKTFKYSHDYLLNVETAHMDKWGNEEKPHGRSNEIQVIFELANPFHDCLPRIYNNAYIKHYGIDDPWIGKIIYRLPLVNNKVLLELANWYSQQCQSYQSSELIELTNWCHSLHFEYILSTRSKENINMRIFFTKACCMGMLIDDILDSATSIEVINSVQKWDISLSQKLPLKYKIHVQELYNTILVMTETASKIHQILSSKFIHNYLSKIYTDLIKSRISAHCRIQGYIPSFKEYMQNAEVSISIGSPVLMSILFCGEPLTEELLNTIHDSKPLKLNNIIFRLCNDNIKAQGVWCYHPGETEEDALSYLQKVISSLMTKIYPKMSKSEILRWCGWLITYNKTRHEDLVLKKLQSFLHQLKTLEG